MKNLYEILSNEENLSIFSDCLIWSNGEFDLSGQCYTWNRRSIYTIEFALWIDLSSRDKSLF